MKKTLALLNITGLIIGISYGMHNPIVPIFAKNEIGASYAELGLIGMANFVPYMFIPVVVGILLGRYNNGSLLSVGVVINTASVYLLSVAKSVPELMILRAMTGIAHAFFWPPAESIISNSSEGQLRVKNLGYFTGFFVSGFMIGPLAGTFLLHGMDITYRMLFVVATFIMASAIVFSLQIAKKDIQKKDPKFSFSGIKHIAKFPVTVIVLIYCASSFGIILTIYPAFLNDRSMTPTEIEILYFVFGISRIITLALTGRLASRTGTTLIASNGAISLGLLISFFSDSIFSFAAAMLIMGFGFSVIFPLTLEIILKKLPARDAGAAIGAYETTFGIGWAAGPITAGLISEFGANSMPYVIFFVIGVGVFVLCLVKKKSLEPLNV